MLSRSSLPNPSAAPSLPNARAQRTDDLARALEANMRRQHAACTVLRDYLAQHVITPLSMWKGMLVSGRAAHTSHLCAADRHVHKGSRIHCCLWTPNLRLCMKASGARTAEMLGGSMAAAVSLGVGCGPPFGLPT